jgi:guanylate kinase
VGKGPLHAALKKFYPALTDRLVKLVLYNSRAARPGELDGVDYHFRSRDHIEGLRQNEAITVFDVRGDLQALDADDLRGKLAESDVFFEGYAFAGAGLLDLAAEQEIECLSVFLAPLSKDEIECLKAPERGVALPDFLTDVMRRKLSRRTAKQKQTLSLKDLEDIERRASSAYSELKCAWRFDHVIPSHDGEDSEHWDAFYYPIGDARQALVSLAALLEGKTTAWVEKWGPDLVP